MRRGLPCQRKLHKEARKNSLSSSTLSNEEVETACVRRIAHFMGETPEHRHNSKHRVPIDCSLLILSPIAVRFRFKRLGNLVKICQRFTPPRLPQQTVLRCLAQSSTHPTVPIRLAASFLTSSTGDKRCGTSSLFYPFCLHLKLR